MSPHVMPEEFLAKLTDAAYRVVLRHGIKGSFLDVELALWKALRSVASKEGDRRIQTGRSSE
jgi:hypothetical protein